MRAWAAAVAASVAAVALAGCAGEEAQARLPGVRTDSRVEDSYMCGALLFAEGCVVVRIPRAESGCAPEAPGYVVCNATVHWSATSGAAVPGSRLATVAGGVEGPSCEPAPGSPCTVEGTHRFLHRFSGPGQDVTWALAVTAVLESPGGLPQADGSFTLALAMDVRTEPAAAADA